MHKLIKYRQVLLFAIVLFLLLILGYLLYRLGFTGPLLLDDFWNLQPLGEEGGVRNWTNFLRFVFGNDSGPSGRPVAMLSFLIDGQDWPINVAAFKYTNVLLHLLTGALLCWLAILVFRAMHMPPSATAALALLLAALWLLHPFNISTTLYVVQRMTQLMTLFTLCALICYVMGREQVVSNPRRGLLLLCMAMFPFGLLAVLSKENGVLLLLAIVCFEVTLFQEKASNRLFKAWLSLAVLLPLTLVAAYLLISMPENLGHYATREFSLVERLLTEMRILCLYLANIILPNTLAVGLYHDDYLISTSILQPVTTLVSLLVISALLGTAGYVRKTQPVFSFSVFWFFSMHLLESTYIPLELYFEHRNYLAMVGPLFACVWYLWRLYLHLSPQNTRLLSGASIGVCLLCAALTWQQTNLWGNTLALTAHWAETQPGSVRAQMSFADSLKYLNEPELAMERLELAHQNNPKEVTILLSMWNLACESGLPPPYTIEQIVNYPELEYFQDDINLHLKILLENLFANKCAFPNESSMVNLFNKVGEFAMPDFRKSTYHFYFSDLYIYYGRLNLALINLTRAFEANPVAQIPIRQAILSASANNFSDALVFLGRAREADVSSSSFLPSSEAEISRLEKDFTHLLELSNQGI